MFRFAEVARILGLSSILVFEEVEGPWGPSVLFFEEVERIFGLLMF